MCEDDIVCDDEGDILIFVMTRMIFVFNDSMFVMIFVFYGPSRVLHFLGRVGPFTTPLMDDIIKNMLTADFFD